MIKLPALRLRLLGRDEPGVNMARAILSAMRRDTATMGGSPCDSECGSLRVPGVSLSPDPYSAIVCPIQMKVNRYGREEIRAEEQTQGW